MLALSTNVLALAPALLATTNSNVPHIVRPSRAVGVSMYRSLERFANRHEGTVRGQDVLRQLRRLPSRSELGLDHVRQLQDLLDFPWFFDAILPNPLLLDGLMRALGLKDDRFEPMAELLLAGGIRSLANRVRARNFRIKDVPPSFVTFHPRTAARNWLWWQPEYDVLLLCHRPGSVQPIHTHGGAVGVDYVLSGTMREERFLPYQEDTLLFVGSRIYQQGEALVVNDEGIHRISNASDTESLLTLHFYTPPIPVSKVETWYESDVVNA